MKLISIFNEFSLFSIFFCPGSYIYIVVIMVVFYSWIENPFLFPSITAKLKRKQNKEWRSSENQQGRNNSILFDAQKLIYIKFFAVEERIKKNMLEYSEKNTSCSSILLTSTRNNFWPLFASKTKRPKDNKGWGAGMHSSSNNKIRIK